MVFRVFSCRAVVWCWVLWPFVLLLFHPPAWSAFEFRPVGARSGGLGDTFVGLASGAEGVFWNPGSVGLGRGLRAVGGYERPFGMAELETQVLGVVVPLGRHALGFSYQGYGFVLYRERAVGVTYGYAFSKRLGLGVRVRGLQVVVAELKDRRWTVFDLGIQARLRADLILGLAAWNASGKAVGVLGQGGLLGVGVAVGHDVWVLADVRKEAGTPTGAGMGLEYRFGSRAALRAGAGAHPERMAVGLGIGKGSVGVDYAAVWHAVLGVSHRVSVRFGE